MAEKILVHQIPRKIEEVYPYFASMEQFVSIHPVIYKFDAVSHNEYRLYERLTIVGLGASFSYPVTIEQLIPNKQVIYYSEIRKSAKLKLVFDFEQEGNGTKITETVTFDGPFLISPFFISFLARIHQKMINNIVAQV